MKHIVVICAAVLVGAACITDPTARLFIVLDTQPPAITSDSVVRLSGQATRNPPRTEPIVVVTITGGARTVVDTTDGFRLFKATVPLIRNSENRLTISASDNTGAVSENPLTVVVVQQDSL
ncbi:MAG: hypothetical protein ACE5HT_13530 [Gemmatimonadales bacterium]